MSLILESKLEKVPFYSSFWDYNVELEELKHNSTIERLNRDQIDNTFEPTTVWCKSKGSDTSDKLQGVFNVTEPELI